MLVGVVNETQFGNASPEQARQVVDVYPFPVEDVGGKGRDACTARSQQTPGLAAENFKRAFANVNPVQPRTEQVTVGRYRNVGAGGRTQKVGFHVAHHMRSVDVRISAEA